MAQEICCGRGVTRCSICTYFVVITGCLTVSTIYIYMLIYIYIHYAQICNVCVYVYVSVCICLYVHMSICLYIHTCIYIYTYMYIYMYIDVYIVTQ